MKQRTITKLVNAIALTCQAVLVIFVSALALIMCYGVYLAFNGWWGFLLFWLMGFLIILTPVVLIIAFENLMIWLDEEDD